MDKLLIKNCRIIYPDRIESGSVLIGDGKILEINPANTTEAARVIDAEQRYLSPGFIDVHIHGAGGCDVTEGTTEAISCVAKEIAKHGTTAFLATTMTVGSAAITKALACISGMTDVQTGGAVVLGAHLEGPFVSMDALGAQNPAHVQKPSIDAYNKLVGDFGHDVRRITMLAEDAGALELARYLAPRGVVCSIGHTVATYEQAIAAHEAGFSHATHLFNAMTPLSHRAPGVVGAVFDSAMTGEIIADGVHIAYPVMRIAIKQKTADGLILISDAMCACGMPDGKYDLGGLSVTVKGDEARTDSGSLAGSVLTLDKAVRNIYRNTALPLHEVVRMATLNPAKHCGADDRKGRIAEGFDADLLLFDEDINISHVLIDGKVIVG